MNLEFTMQITLGEHSWFEFKSSFNKILNLWSKDMWKPNLNREPKLTQDTNTEWNQQP
jgi:hypothetical protein